MNARPLSCRTLCAAGHKPKASARECKPEAPARAGFRPRWRFGLASLTLLAAALPGFAQGDRRDRQDPELVVESGGRQSTCDQLLFTADARYLLAAGDDKVVRVWPCSDGRLQGRGQKVLRWSIWREQRGSIYALAVSPDGSRVAVGGLGVRISTVVLIDRASGKVLRSTYPQGQPGEDFFSVMALAFDPRGERVAYGTADGSVWLWDLQTSRRLGKLHGSDPINHIRLVHFLDDSHLLAVAASGEVARWDLDRAEAGPTSLFVARVEKSRVFRAAVSPDGRWLAAAAKGSPGVAVRSLDGLQSRDIALQPGEFPRSIAFDRRGRRLAVGIGRMVPGTDFYLEDRDRIAIYDLADQPGAAPAEGPPHSWHADNLAFHPDGRHLAIAGGDNHEVTLWDLDHLDKPASVMRSAGSCLWEVALSKDGRLLGFREGRAPGATDPNQRGRGPWRVFDLAGREWDDPKEFQPLPHRARASGWRVRPDRNDPYVWYAVDPDGNEHTLPLDRDREGMPRCWAFVPVKEGAPPLLAVGHYWGLSVFELTREGARRTCLCAGHQGEVMALGASGDGSWLVTASNDQTIAAFSLVGAARPDLGGRFSLRDGRLFVDAVTSGGAAWEAGLQSGDEIELFKLATQVPPGGPAAWREQLLRPEPGKEHYFRILRQGKRLELVTTSRRRPLWRFYPTREGEWVLWMWRSSYYDTSTKGDFQIGWHVNSPDRNLAGTPTFYKAEQFRKHFHRQDVIDKLLDSRDPQAVLEQLTANPVPWRFDQAEPPAVALKAGPVRPGRDVEATLSITPHGDNPDYQPVSAELWLNDFRLKEWTRFDDWHQKDRTLTLVFTVPQNRLRAGRNVLTFQTYNALGGRSDAVEKVEVLRAAARPRLLGLAVGINDYGSARVGRGGRGKLENLRSAGPDAQDMARAWSAQPLYANPRMRPLVNAQAGRKELLAALDEAAELAQPDDRFVLFLAGHGTFLTRKGESTFIFCCPRFDPDDAAATGLTSDELYRKLAAIPCRKLVLFDACHSGVAADPARLLTPGGQGPTVLAACDRNQLSWEDPDLGHGLFTLAVLEALGHRFGQADTNGDGRLDSNELYQYTLKRMPQLLRQIKRKEHIQVPLLYAPPDDDGAPLAVRPGRKE
jgi:WD40 repeat protein